MTALPTLPIDLANHFFRFSPAMQARRAEQAKQKQAKQGDQSKKD